MRIGIDVNGVLRDTVEKFRQVYEKHMIDENSDDSFSESNTYELDVSGNTEELKSESLFEYKIISEVTSLDLSNHFSFRSKEEYYSFLYEEFPMQIFGHAPSTEMTTFNELNNFYTKFRDEHDIVIISDEMGKSKPATLFFLSKFGCLAESIIFYNSVTKDRILSNFDLIVTSNPEIIINYSNKLTVVKYETKYNKQVDANFSIYSLKELAETINKISNAETIQ
jgi:hypothetical protein